MTQALGDFDGSVEVGGRSVTNLWFADDIDLIAGSTDELPEITERLDRTSRELGMEISAEKSKVMITSAQNTPVDMSIKIGTTDLELVNDFKYLGVHITKDATSTREITIRLAH